VNSQICLQVQSGIQISVTNKDRVALIVPAVDRVRCDRPRKNRRQSHSHRVQLSHLTSVKLRPACFKLSKAIVCAVTISPCLLCNTDNEATAAAGDGKDDELMASKSENASSSNFFRDCAETLSCTERARELVYGVAQSVTGAGTIDVTPQTDLQGRIILLRVAARLESNERNSRRTRPTGVRSRVNCTQNMAAPTL